MWEYDRKLIGARIKKARKAIGWTQEMLAEEVNCGPRHIGQIERGTCGMSVEMLVNICLALKTNIDTLLLGQFMVEEDEVQKLILTLPKCTPEKRVIIQGILEGIERLAQEP